MLARPLLQYRSHILIGFVSLFLLSAFFLYRSASVEPEIPWNVKRPRREGHIHQVIPDDGADSAPTPKITVRVRKSQDRGHFKWDWLDTYHSFSFGDYWDPAFDNFGALKVLNEDIISPRRGFDTHPHKNFNIFTYVIEGELEHRDSLQKEAEMIPKGVVQFTCAGKGIFHSEKNIGSKPAHILQIWITPLKKDEQPYYVKKTFDDSQKRGKLVEIVSNVNPDAIGITSDVRVFASKLEKKESVSYDFVKRRKLYIHLVNLPTSQMMVNKEVLNAGDGAFVFLEPKTERQNLVITCLTRCEFLLIDLAL